MPITEGMLGSPIRIKRVQVADTVLRKKDPYWRFALGARPLSRGVVVKLVSEEGVRGYGWAGEVEHLGYELTAVRATVEELTTSLCVVRPDGVGPLLVDLEHRAMDCNPAAAGVETAVLDLLARTAGTPLYTLLGGRHRDRVPLMRILGIKAPEEMAANALKLVNEGYRHLKIKIDNNPLELDVDRIRAIREIVGPAARLTLDANQSYEADEAVRLYEAVADQSIDVFEQPVPAGELDQLRRVSEAVNCIVEADESADSLSSVVRLAGTQGCSGISLKLLKLGGLRATLHAARICGDAGVRCRVGAHVGSQLLGAAALHATAGIENIDYACELAEFARLDDDPFTGLSVEGGDMPVGTSPGLGVCHIDDEADQRL